MRTRHVHYELNDADNSGDYELNDDDESEEEYEMEYDLEADEDVDLEEEDQVRSLLSCLIIVFG